METVKRTPHAPNATAYRRTAKNERYYDHREYGGKVTLRDFRAKRWQAQANAGDLYTFTMSRSFHQWKDSGLETKYYPRRQKDAKRISLPNPTPIAYMMSSPVDMPRMQTVDQVRGDAKKLASKTAKLLTMNSEYIARRSFAKARAEKEPPYEQRLARVCPVKPTRQSEPKPFESGESCLPGMEAFMRRALCLAQYGETEVREAA